MPLAVFFYELLKGDTLNTISGMILTDSLLNVTKANNIIFQTTSHPATMLSWSLVHGGAKNTTFWERRGGESAMEDSELRKKRRIKRWKTTKSQSCEEIKKGERP